MAERREGERERDKRKWMEVKKERIREMSWRRKNGISNDTHD